MVITKKILVLQHIEIEYLDNIQKFLNIDKKKIVIIKLFENQKIPDNLNFFSMMIVLGGPMDTCMEDRFPWLKDEKKKIREFAIELERPFLGICLGCQLFGEVLGGKIVKSSKKEIGFYKVSTNPKINNDKIFYKLPKNFNVFQWHSYEVKDIKNPFVKVLASSKSTKVQLFRYKNHAYGMQFHIEIDRFSLKKWLANKEYKDELTQQLGKSAEKDLINRSSMEISNIENICKMMMTNFKKIISG